MNASLAFVVMFLAAAVAGTFLIWRAIWRRMARAHVEKAVQLSLLKDYDGAKKHMLVAVKLNKNIKDIKQMVEFYEQVVQKNGEFLSKNRSELLNLSLRLE